MSNPSKRILFWSPRLLGILFAVFISLFALDVFDEAHGFWQTAAALGMHLIPTFALVIVLIVSWRWEWVGAAAFTALAVLYLAWAPARLPWAARMMIAGPLILLAGLFLANWVRRAELKA